MTSDLACWAILNQAVLDTVHVHGPRSSALVRKELNLLYEILHDS